MAKKREEQPDEGSPAWMATFSDLMNLLLCFFVLLFASSTMDEGKIQQIAASFQNISFSIFTQTSQMVENGQMVSGGVTQLEGIQTIMDQVGKSVDKTDGQTSQSVTNNGADPDSTRPGQVGGDATTEQEGEMDMEALQNQMEKAGLEQSEEMYMEISQALESYTIDERIQIDYNSQYVVLDMNGALLFDTGDAELKEESYVFMNKIASILEAYRYNVVEIEGHTDNVPIHTSHFESNRYLSTARATNVYEYLMQHGNLIDENMKVAGYGESRPVASNDTPEGRARNRRVVIKIYNQLSSSQE